MNFPPLPLPPSPNTLSFLFFSLSFSFFLQDIQANSPAAQAGLHAHTDYIVAADTSLDDRDDLYTLIDIYNQKPLRLYVYNSSEDACRDVIITPNNRWGGEGSLGCGIGYGYLHRIPKREAAASPAKGPSSTAAGAAGAAAAAATAAAASPKGSDGFTDIALASPAPSNALPAFASHHGHSHDGVACHGHGHAAPAPPPPPPVQQHGHSHADGTMCTGHHDAPLADPVQVAVLADTLMSVLQLQEDPAAPAPPAAAAPAGHHGHSHDGVACTGHHHETPAPQALEPLVIDLT